MLSAATEEEDRPAAVLIRGVEVVEGHQRQVLVRRGGRMDCIGPGKVGRGLGHKNEVG